MSDQMNQCLDIVVGHLSAMCDDLNRRGMPQEASISFAVYTLIGSLSFNGMPMEDLEELLTLS